MSQQEAMTVQQAQKGVQQHYGTQKGQPGYNPLYDFNRDNRIDMSDLQLVSSQQPSQPPTQPLPSEPGRVTTSVERALYGYIVPPSIREKIPMFQGPPAETIAQQVREEQLISQEARVTRVMRTREGYQIEYVLPSQQLVAEPERPPPKDWVEWFQRGWEGITEPYRKAFFPTSKERFERMGLLPTRRKTYTGYLIRKTEQAQAWFREAPIQEQLMFTPLGKPEFRKPIVEPIAQALEMAYIPTGAVRTLQSYFKPTPTATGAVTQTLISPITKGQFTTQALSEYWEQTRKHPGLLIGEIIGEIALGQYVLGPAIQKVWGGTKWVAEKAAKGYVTVGRVTYEKVFPATLKYGFEPVAKRVVGEEAAYYFGRIAIPQLPRTIAASVVSTGRTFAGKAVLPSFIKYPLAETVAKFSYAKWRIADPFYTTKLFPSIAVGIPQKVKYKISDIQQVISYGKWRAADPFYTHKLIPSVTLGIPEKLKYKVSGIQETLRYAKWRIADPFYTHKLVPGIQVGIPETWKYKASTLQQQLGYAKWRVTEPFYTRVPKLSLPSVSWPSLYGTDMISLEAKAFNKVIAGKLRWYLHLPAKHRVAVTPFTTVAKETGKKAFYESSLKGYWQLGPKQISKTIARTATKQAATTSKALATSAATLLIQVTKLKPKQKRKRVPSLVAYAGPRFKSIYEQKKKFHEVAGVQVGALLRQKGRRKGRTVPKGLLKAWEFERLGQPQVNKQVQLPRIAQIQLPKTAQIERNLEKQLGSQATAAAQMLKQLQKQIQRQPQPSPGKLRSRTKRERRKRKRSPFFGAWFLKHHPIPTPKELMKELRKFV